MMSDHASYTSCVSIHASAREATFSVVKLTSVLDVFQSTPPHGRRQPHADPDPTCHSFNPRLRTGGDLGVSQTNDRFPVSIHASAREATSLL